MKAFSVVFLGVLAALSLWLCRRQKAECVSEQWRKEQEREDDRRGIDGVSIRFPIRKIVNEAGMWNRTQEQRRRKRA